MWGICKKTILIGGSIAATILIVLASFTSVVGYTSVRDSKIVDSPLFSIRSERAINNKNLKIIKSEYIVKNNIFLLTIPRRIPFIEKGKIFFEKIQNLDTKQFDLFIKKFKEASYENEQINQMQIPEVIHNLKLIKKDTTHENIERYIRSYDHSKLDPTFDCMTVGLQCYISYFFIFLALLLFYGFIFLLNIIDSFFPNSLM